LRRPGPSKGDGEGPRWFLSAPAESFQCCLLPPATPDRAAATPIANPPSTAARTRTRTRTSAYAAATSAVADAPPITAHRGDDRVGRHRRGDRGCGVDASRHAGCARKAKRKSEQNGPKSSSTKRVIFLRCHAAIFPSIFFIAYRCKLSSEHTPGTLVGFRTIAEITSSPEVEESVSKSELSRCAA
jgi:hypothetical protein